MEHSPGEEGILTEQSESMLSERPVSEQYDALGGSVAGEAEEDAKAGWPSEWREARDLTIGWKKPPVGSERRTVCMRVSSTSAPSTDARRLKLRVGAGAAA